MRLRDRLESAGERGIVAWTDVLAAIAVAILAVGSILIQDVQPEMLEPNAFAIAMALAASASLVYRRKYPIGSLWLPRC